MLHLFIVKHHETISFKDLERERNDSSLFIVYVYVLMMNSNLMPLLASQYILDKRSRMNLM